MKHALVLFVVLALGGCVSHNFSEGQRTYFRCDGDREFTVRRLPPAIEVYASGTTHRLEPVAEGQYRSRDGAVALTQDSGQTRLTGIHNGPFENCRRRARWPSLF